VHAPHFGIAGIGGAGVGVVAVDGGSRLAQPVLALVAHRALVVVIAGEAVVGIDTPGGRVAPIVGARVQVVTVQQAAGGAGLAAAGISDSAGVAVVTRQLVGHVETALKGIAEVRGTRIGIIAVHRIAAEASALDALVFDGAEIVIIAGSCAVRVDAARLRVTDLGGAHVPVVAIQAAGRRALSVLAVVPHCAGIAVIAQDLQVGVGADALVRADILGARIAVVTVLLRAADALALLALISHGTGVAIRAAPRGLLMLAADLEKAEVSGALVIVVAVDQAGGDADTLDAMVPRGAFVEVVAPALEFHVGASQDGVAVILGAGARVIADHWNPGRALTRFAHIVESAAILIVTRARQRLVNATQARMAGVGGT